MNKNIKILRLLLFGGCIYFFLVARFNLVGIKIPPFFIYYNVPSNVYQDKIIAFLVFGWSVFLFTAFLNPIKNKMLIQAILVAGAGAIIGLEMINTFTDFKIFSNDLNPTIYRLEILELAAYLVLLTVFYNKTKNQFI